GGYRRNLRERENADVRPTRLPGRVSARGATGDPAGPPIWRGGGVAAQASVGSLSVPGRPQGLLTNSTCLTRRQIMLTFWDSTGAAYRDNMSRRNFLRVGGLGVAGLTLADVLRLRASAGTTAAPPRAVIMILLGGGPSHIDMYDLKPNAPAEVRGEFKPIKTNVPGFDISELMPQQARIADKLALVRNLQMTTSS